MLLAFFLIYVVVDHELMVVAISILPHNSCCGTHAILFIVVQDSILYLSRWESEQHLNTQKVVLLEEIKELLSNSRDNQLKLRLVNLQLFLLCSRSEFIIDSSHECIVWNLFLDEIVEDGHSASLIKDPSLLGLIYNSPEKLRTSLD